MELLNSIKLCIAKRIGGRMQPPIFYGNMDECDDYFEENNLYCTGYGVYTEDEHDRTMEYEGEIDDDDDDFINEFLSS